MAKKRLDVLLTEQGYFESRQKAQATIMSGLVFVDGRRVDKAGAAVAEGSVPPPGVSAFSGEAAGPQPPQTSSIKAARPAAQHDLFRIRIPTIPAFLFPCGLFSDAFRIARKSVL